MNFLFNVFIGLLFISLSILLINYPLLIGMPSLIMFSYIIGALVRW